MRRRDALALLGGSAVGWPLAATAQQQSKLPLVGIFGGSVRPEYDAFLQGMHDLGYVDGRNISYAQRFLAGNPEAVGRSAQDLVSLKPDVILSASMVRPVMEATSTIPIVFANVSDAVENGVVHSLARPGGNATGLSIQNADLVTKRLQLLRETLPNVRRIADFREVNVPQSYRDAMAVAGRALGLELQSVEITGPDSFDSAFEAAIAAGAGALTAAAGRIVTPNREQFAALAAKYRLPTMYAHSVVVHAGGLMSYGPNFPDLWRRAAAYVDKILKGAKPGDLPVEQPIKFKFVINLKTAKALGLGIPLALLARADEVIE